MEPTTPPNRFTPSPADVARYADYSLDVRESSNPVSVVVHDGQVTRWIMTILRIPSAKTFRVYVRNNVTPSERAHALAVATRLSAGEWARFPESWSRHRARTFDGDYFEQVRGPVVPDDLIDLELELMLDREGTASVA